MRSGLTTSARSLVAAAVVASAMAVGLARLGPVPTAVRVASWGRPVLIGPDRSATGRPGSVWFDAETGRTTLVPAPGGESVQLASASPWCDESGRSQVVGRSSRRPGDPAIDQVGLVRMSFPDGRLLDRIATDLLPASPPAWYPGTAAAVLFAAGDGRLHRFAFEPESHGSSPTVGGELDDRPRPLTWNCPPPGRGEPLLSFPHWPAGPRWRRMILAVLAPGTAPGAHRFSPGRIWWLGLDLVGDTIEEAGPIFDADALPKGVEVASPSVVATPGGGLALAYFTTGEGPPWVLRIAPLRFDESGRPRVSGGPGVRLAEGCRATVAATTSADGRWLFAVRSDAPDRETILRIDLLAALAGPPEPVVEQRPSWPAPAGHWSILVAIVRALLVELGVIVEDARA